MDHWGTIECGRIMKPQCSSASKEVNKYKTFDL